MENNVAIVVRCLETKYLIEFERNERQLENYRLYADSKLNIDSNRILALEVETSQLTPERNIIKYGPYLDDGNFLVLLHCFMQTGLSYKEQNIRYSDWLVAKFNKLYPSNFKYYKLIFNGTDSEFINKNEEFEFKALLSKY